MQAMRRDALIISAAAASRRQVTAVQVGVGTDLHGRSPTTAAERACRDAIQLNEIPALYDADAKLRVRVGVPSAVRVPVN